MQFLRAFLTFVVTVLIFTLSFGQAVTSTGFHWPLGLSQGSYTHGSGGWLYGGPGEPSYITGLYHLGEDMIPLSGVALNHPVYAISDGVVLKIYTSDVSTEPSWQIGLGNSVMFVKHRLADGSYFLACYMHVIPSVKENDSISAGQQIAKVGAYKNVNGVQYSADHLHFGIHRDLTWPTSSWGRYKLAYWDHTNGYEDPVAFLSNYSPWGSGIGAGATFPSHFTDCYSRSGGSGRVGTPVDRGSGPNVHKWGSATQVEIQDYLISGAYTAIIDKPAANSVAHFLYGSIWSSYAALGGPDSSLHGPTGDETATLTSPFGTTGDIQTFEGGNYYSSSKGALPVLGALLTEFYAISGYNGSGGSGSPLGFPNSSESPAPASPFGTTGSAQSFEGGSIFSSGKGAFSLIASFNLKYIDLTQYNGSGGSGSPLGFPTSDQLTAPSSGASQAAGTYQAFEGGRIYSSAPGGVCVVLTSINAKYVGLSQYTGTGGSGSPLGFPTSDEVTAPVSGATKATGDCQVFEGGRIYSSVAGVHPVLSSMNSCFQNLGGSGSTLGFPAGEEVSGGTSRLNTSGDVQQFEGGVIFASKWGVFPVQGLVNRLWTSSGGITGRYGYPKGNPVFRAKGVSQQQFEGGIISLG